MAPRFKLTPVNPKNPLAPLVSEVNVVDTETNQSYPLLEWTPSVTKRYVVMVETGDFPPQQAHAYLTSFRELGGLDNLFGKDNYIVASMRHQKPSFLIYELDQIADELNTNELAR